MSRVPYTVHVEEYICSALEQMRKMNETRDYSGLAAAIERIQFHANQMESALYTYEGIKYTISNICRKSDAAISDAEFREKVTDTIMRMYKDRGEEFKRDTENEDMKFASDTLSDV